ncbi:hypothetical protein BOX15_Mlig012432g3 [Macrostomum lignano]|uniref:Vacuolar protein sorting-associated protein 26 n=1 Tax=Macrostomum lignano TaxID=282301 RepID=A0A267DA09_9PLAT|nr:hypothetical protein BOX15_Mlig012432g3 [Macrostomum lignano]
MKNNKQNFLFGPSADLEIHLDGSDDRQKGDVLLDSGKKEACPVYFDGEAVSGKVNIRLKQSKMEHYGIRVELLGLIEQFSDRSSQHEFLSMARELARPGILTQSCCLEFEFVSVEKPYESYFGVNVKLRYFIRVTVTKRLNDLVKEQDFLVHTLAQYPDTLGGIKMEVGIEDCLHIEFEYNKSKYHLKDAIIGKIYFLLVRIKVRHMEVQILRRELVGVGPNSMSDCETVAKFEIMDGAPVKGETIPIRLFLSGYELTPTMRDVNKRFSVRYFLNLVLIDEEDRRYFKQQEVTLFRRRPNRHRRIAQEQQHQSQSADTAQPVHQQPDRSYFHHRSAHFGAKSPAAASGRSAANADGANTANNNNDNEAAVSPGNSDDSSSQSGESNDQ